MVGGRGLVGWVAMVGGRGLAVRRGSGIENKEDRDGGLIGWVVQEW